MGLASYQGRHRRLAILYRIEKWGPFLEIAIVDWRSISIMKKNDANFWVYKIYIYIFPAVGILTRQKKKVPKR